MILIRWHTEKCSTLPGSYSKTCFCFKELRQGINNTQLYIYYVKTDIRLFDDLLFWWVSFDSNKSLDRGKKRKNRNGRRTIARNFIPLSPPGKRYLTLVPSPPLASVRLWIVHPTLTSSTTNLKQETLAVKTQDLFQKSRHNFHQPTIENKWARPVHKKEKVKFK